MKLKICFHRKYLLLLAGLFAFSGCKKIEPIHYNGETSLFFLNAYTAPVNYIPRNYQDLFTDTLTMNCHLSEVFQKDTIALSAPGYYNSFHLGSESYFPGNLWVYLKGPLATTIRPFELTIEGSGSSFCILPDMPLYLAADSTRTAIDLKILRPPIADTTTYEVRVKLGNNSNFTPEMDSMSEFVYRFGNLPTKPERWRDEFLGSFSYNKIGAIALALTAADESERTLLRKQLKDLSSTWFTDEVIDRDVLPAQVTAGNIYLMINNGYRPSGGNAKFDTMLTSLATITKDYLNERSALGSPLLEKDGKPIVFTNSN
ncbi:MULTISPECIES: hypothetical protein [unclassified Sphingobacterium]|uniref:hypothetical protein n=1 Tax=unclassified Sphingobacterium TaxID=2609468 RepID=UPI0010513B7B|nr:MULTISPECIES: hypothetical protein [unclassified Sphingobacterium]MCS3556160.1 hypothetical protein [Sphingobacterium sp. JUb21]TCR08536.1 hypothetical protein EDF66_10383 [Sphingobacterium sp. JUb20]